MTQPLWLHLQRKYNDVKRTAQTFLGIVILSTLVSCNNNRWDVDTSSVSQSTTFENFAEAFYQNDSAEFYQLLPSIIEEYPFFFTSGDSILWVDQRFDRQLSQLWADYQISFPAEVQSQIQSNIESGLKKFYYHFNQEEGKTVYTYISNLQFDYPVLYVDSINTLFIAADTYLGEDHPAYASFPRYIARRFTPEHIAGDVFEQLALEKMPVVEESTLIDDMVRAGIIRYFQLAVMNNPKPENLLGYTKEQLQFCRDNEANIWLYFVQKQLLFDSSIDTKRRFVFDAPFSKFYTDIDSNTPGRIAEWVGLQIVTSYMEDHKDVTLPELLAMEDYRFIFRDSGYKP